MKKEGRKRGEGGKEERGKEVYMSEGRGWKDGVKKGRQEEERESEGGKKVGRVREEGGMME